MNIIAIDLGGTWIRATFVNENGECINTVRVKTERKRKAEKIIGDLINVIEELRGNRFIRGIAIAAATVTNSEGQLTKSDNLPTLSGIKLGQIIQKITKLPVRVYNDADAYTYGEWAFGVGNGSDNFVGITLGTGIGVGIILGRKIFKGSHGHAGEIWQTPYFDDQPLEGMVNGNAIETAYRIKSGENYGGEQIFSLAYKGNETALNVYSNFGTKLGKITSFIINLLDPECIAFGGSIANSFAFFSESLLNIVNKGVIDENKIVIARSLLGERAALLGAAKLLLEEIEKDNL